MNGTMVQCRKKKKDPQNNDGQAVLISWTHLEMYQSPVGRKMQCCCWKFNMIVSLFSVVLLGCSLWGFRKVPSGVVPRSFSAVPPRANKISPPKSYKLPRQKKKKKSNQNQAIETQQSPREHYCITKSKPSNQLSKKLH